MFWRTIEAIRQKPKAVRKQYAFFVTVVFTAVVTGFWVLSLPARFVAVQESVLSESSLPPTQTAGIPFATMWNQFKDQLRTAITPTQTPIAATSSVSTPSNNDSPQTVQLESGSTITFGTQESGTSSPSVLLRTTGTTTSP
jgi:hypothetical protein